MSERVQLPVRSPADTGTRRHGYTGDPAAAAPQLPSVAAAPEGAPVTLGRPVRASPRPRVTASVEADDPLWSALGDVMDPEFPISIVDLGLVYAVRRQGDVVEVDLTFTATACPCMDFIHEDVRERLLREPGVGEVRIRVVWDPPWTRDRITAAGRATLRRHGVAA